jgi:hypothetical protein
MHYIAGPVRARLVPPPLHNLLCVQVPLPQSRINALLGPLLGHPCAVADALCTFYDLGLLHFHEQVRRCSCLD